MPHFAEPVISSWDEADNQKSDADLRPIFAHTNVSESSCEVFIPEHPSALKVSVCFT